MAGISRRTALAALGGAAVIPFSTWWEAVAQQPGQPVVRHSAHSQQGKAALAIYREAVRIMASRQPGAWDGWTVWYKSHQFPDNWDDIYHLQPVLAQAQREELDRLFGAGTPRRAIGARLLGACPHGSPDFWAWHRMYILFFERLCRKLTGESGFALPYWDYRSNPVLPEEFRAPVGKAANPLWHERWPGYNREVDPLPLPGNQLRYDFLRNPGFSGAQGQSEGSPHGAVHVLLGAGPEREGATEFDMTFVGKSARDPIFWLHHCEIDRLWQCWVAGSGHANPSSASWLDNRTTRPGGYAFMDELTGQIVTVRNRDILDSALVLGRSGYTYDQLPPQPATLFSVSSVGQRELASTERVAAGDGRTDQPLETSASELQRLRGATLFSEGSRRVEVSVEAVEVERSGASNIGVYLNLPAGVSGEAAEPYLVTVISTFGRSPAGAHESHEGHGEEAGETGEAGEAGGGTLVFDATDVVAGLAQRGELGDRLTISTIPLAGARGVNVSIEGVRVRLLESD